MTRFNINLFLKTEQIRLKHVVKGRVKYRYFDGSIEGLKQLKVVVEKLIEKQGYIKYGFISIKTPKGRWVQMTPAAWGIVNIQAWIDQLN